MNNNELAMGVAAALAKSRQRHPTMDGAHNPLPSERIEAERLVETIQNVVLETYRKELCEYLTEGYDQAFELYDGTDHPMWLGKAMAYGELIEALEEGIL